MDGETRHSPLLGGPAGATRRGRVAAVLWAQILFGALVVIGFFVVNLIVLVHTNNNLSSRLDDQATAIQTLQSKVISTLQAEDVFLPHKYVVPALPPRKYQFSRGTCWDFGTLSVFEHQYRLQGQANGWLGPTDYTQFSEQAYGNMMIHICAANQHNRDICLTPTDNVAMNSTEGGEAHLMYAFRNSFETNGLMPVAVCPYIQTVDDSSCPGMGPSMKTNPVRFSIQSFDTLYDRVDIKRRLVTSGRALVWSSPIHSVQYYIPCRPSMASNPQCQAATCQPCPLDSPFPTTCCVVIDSQMYNMDGEFLKHHYLWYAAGHCMTTVGYTDTFLSKSGSRGGFILRNTWQDGNVKFDEFGQTTIRPRGSHSILYFTQQISEAAERFICPNAHNPRNWVICGAGAGANATAGIQACLDPNTQRSAMLFKTPINLQCIDPTLGCTVGLRYFVANSTLNGDDLYDTCFLEVNQTATPPTGRYLCEWNAMPLKLLSLAFEPVVAEQYPNNDDLCGYYFFPYSVAEEAGTLYGGYYVNDYLITFDPQSFAANAASYPQYNYTLLQLSTKQQTPLPSMPMQYPDPDNPFS